MLLFSKIGFVFVNRAMTGCYPQISIAAITLKAMIEKIHPTAAVDSSKKLLGIIKYLVW